MTFTEMRITEAAQLRGAGALDATHWAREIGPRTNRTRDRIALALDNDERPDLGDILWLEFVAESWGENR